MMRRLCYNDGSLSNNSDTDSDEEVKDSKQVPFTQKDLWTNAEDDKLRKVLSNAGVFHWSKIASLFPGKTEKQCELRWSVLSKDYIPWTKKEDKMVAELVSQYGPSHWSFISKHIPGRTNKDCRERWFNYLCTETDTKPCIEQNEQSLDTWEYQEEPAFKKRIESVSPPFSHYTIPNSQPVTRVTNSQYSYKTEEQHHYKTVYPVRASLSDDYHSAIPASGYRMHSNSTPIKFTKLSSGSIDHARIDERSLSHIGNSGLIPIAALKPGILRRKRKHCEQENCLPLQLPVFEAMQSSDYSCSKSVIFTPSTPMKTPVKVLPFSPSQFFNSPCGGHTSEALTSTPVCDKAGGLMTPSTGQKTPQRAKIVFQTPTVTQIATSQLHTPTPFKRALAELERKSGIVQIEQHTPMHIHDDLQEVIAQDTGAAIFQTNLSKRFGSYRLSRGLGAVQQNLERRLSALTDQRKPTFPGIKPETPSKSLLDDASLDFSPPSIFKESLFCAPHLNEAFATPDSPMVFKKSSSPAKLELLDLPSDSEVDISKKPGFKMIACGKTEDQKLMTQLAHSWMRSNNQRSLHAL